MLMQTSRKVQLLILQNTSSNGALRDDKLSKEEKAELKANARIEGERLFSRFLHEVLTSRRSTTIGLCLEPVIQRPVGYQLLQSANWF